MELLHTFTLVHDDIMDADTWRRGRESVHKKWDSSAAILSGDALLVLAYQSLMRTKTKEVRTLTELFNEGALGVCEGQALDIELEDKEEVSNSEYLNMIEKKTGMMISMAAAIGALIGGAKSADLKNFKSFGLASTVLIGRPTIRSSSLFHSYNGYIQSPHNFDTTDYRRCNNGGNLIYLMHYPVDSESHIALFPSWFNVYITSPVFDGLCYQKSN